MGHKNSSYWAASQHERTGAAAECYGLWLVKASLVAIR